MPSLTLSSGLKLAFEHYGDPQGVPAFYFHGWPSSGLQGKVMDEAGRTQGVHVVSMDRPGIGDSDYQPGRQLLDWPVVLQELAEHLGWAQFHVFGVSGCGPAFPVTFYKVYVRPKTGRPLANSVWPATNKPSLCTASVPKDDSQASFPKLPTTGLIVKGLPPAGDYVTTNVAGVNYKSPGYL